MNNNNNNMREITLNEVEGLKWNEKLQYIRGVRNLTQAKLEEVSNLKSGSVSRFEKGKHLPRVTTLTKLSNALNVPLRVFFDK